MGRENSKVLPLLLESTRRISPWWLARIPFDMESPNPVPSERFVRNDSNIRSCMSLGMP